MHPGYDEAIKYGYTLYSTAGNSATYTKDGLFLHIRQLSDQRLRAELRAQVRLITLTTGEIAWPHKLFARVFEKQMLQAYLNCLEVVESEAKEMSL